LITLDQLTNIIVDAEFKLDQCIKVICSLTDEEIAVVEGRHGKVQSQLTTTCSQLKMQGVEGNETVTNCNGLEMNALGGEMRLTDVANSELTSSPRRTA